MPAAFLFCMYFVILWMVLIRLSNHWQLDITPKVIFLIFLFKVVLGCLYGYVFLHYYGGDDTWGFFKDSLPEYQKLIHHPLLFLRDLLPGPTFNGSSGFLKSLMLYIQDLEFWLMVKGLAVCNLFSQGNYYTDSLLFDGITLAGGPLLLFKWLRMDFPDKKRELLFALFFIPSCTFWLSGIRAEGMLLVFIALFLYGCRGSRLGYSPRGLSPILLGLIGIVILRMEVLALLLPAVCCWMISARAAPKKVALYFAGVYLLCTILFFATMHISPTRNLATPIIGRQAAFQELQGNTRFRLDPLQPTFSSFLLVAPQAIANGFVRPYPWESKHILQWCTALDVLAGWGLVTYFCFQREKKPKWYVLQPFVLLCLFFGITQILCIAYIVPFPGAIARYKSIPEYFLLLGLIIGCRWPDFPIKNYNNMSKNP